MGKAYTKERSIKSAEELECLRVGCAMTDAAVQSFFEKMVKAGVVKPGIDVRKGYTLQFVDKGIGLDLRPK